jgi:hypothetical protein
LIDFLNCNFGFQNYRVNASQALELSKVDALKIFETSRFTMNILRIPAVNIECATGTWLLYLSPRDGSQQLKERKRGQPRWRSHCSEIDSPVAQKVMSVATRMIDIAQ